MNAVAFYLGKTVIFWNGIVIALGILSGFFLSYAIYTAHSGRGTAMWLFLPVSLVLSVLFCRIIHYFCYPTQYGGFLTSVLNYSAGSFCLPGAVFGILLAGVTVEFLGFADSVGELLDAVAPGAVLTFAFIRLSALFNNTLRGKIVITEPNLRHLPVASALTDAAGNVTYRFSSFFASFILLSVICIAVTMLYYKRHSAPMKRGCSRKGNVARMALVLWGCAEIICDSTRFDAPHLKFGSGTAIGRLLTKAAGFVGINMVIAAVSIVCVFVHYSRLSVRTEGLKAKHWLLWIGFILCLALVGGSEYLYQRFALTWLYGVMAAGLIGWICLTFAMYGSCRLKKNR